LLMLACWRLCVCVCVCVCVCSSGGTGYADGSRLGGHLLLLAFPIDGGVHVDGLGAAESLSWRVSVCASVCVRVCVYLTACTWMGWERRSLCPGERGVWRWGGGACPC